MRALITAALLLLRAQPAGWRLHLDAGEHRHLLANHLRRDRDRAPADQVSTALAQSELHRSAVLITQCAGVIAPESGLAAAAGDADVLLDLLLSHLPNFELAMDLATFIGTLRACISHLTNATLRLPIGTVSSFQSTCSLLISHAS